MSQNDLVIANQSFPSFRTDLNSALQAINTSHSGTSRPSGAVAGTIWLDTTGTPTSNTLKFFDGTDDISLATINYTANTVDWLDSSVTITGLSTSATGTVLTLTDSAHTTTVNMICGNNTALRFNELTANGSNYIGLKAPASLSADLTFTLPSLDGTSGQFLRTDGAGNLSFASLSFATPLAVVGNATAGSSIRLPEDTDNGSNFVALKAPDTLAADLTLTLPSADGTSGQVLQTNGSGVLSFAGVSASAGQVIQVVTATASAVNITSTTDVTTNITASITPSSASNKILILITSIVNFTDYASRANDFCGVNLKRGATSIVGGGNNDFASVYSVSPHNFSYPIAISYVDSPSTTSSTTYTLFSRIQTAGEVVSWNGGIGGRITLLEIKG